MPRIGRPDSPGYGPGGRYWTDQAVPLAGAIARQDQGAAARRGTPSSSSRRAMSAPAVAGSTSRSR